MEAFKNIYILPININSIKHTGDTNLHSSGKNIPSITLDIAVVVMIVFIALASTPITVNAQVPSRNEYVASCFYDAVLAYNPYNPQGGKPGMGFMYPTLFIYDSVNNAILPFIGERFEIVDPYTIRIYIRPEARWSDGKPITAYDLYYTSWLSTQLGGGPCTGCYRHMRIISDKVFEYTTYIVEEGVKPDTPTLNLNTVLGILLTEIYPSHILMDLYNKGGDEAVRTWRNDDPETQVVSGPYKLKYFDPYNYVVFERIDNWWGKDTFGLPAPKYFIYVGCRDNTVAVGRLQNGEIDWWTGFIVAVWELFPYGIGTWSNKPPYFRSGVPIILGFNMRNPVIADPVVRKAIAYAIPYSEVISKGYYNYSIQASACGITDVYPAYAEYLDKSLCIKYWGTDTCRIPYNPEKAKQILLEAGYRLGPDGYFRTPDGKEIKLIASVPQGWTDWMAIIEIIANSLNNIGLKVEVRYYDAGVYFDKISRGEEIDLWMVGAEGPGPEHPLNTFRSIMVTWIASWMNYKNDEATQLVNIIPTLSDPTAIKKAYSRLQEIYYQEMPAVPLFYGAIWYAYNTKYWTGWPTAENPWWGETWAGASSSLPVMFGLKPAGQVAQPPAWAKTIDKGGYLIPISQILIELARGAETTTPPLQTETQVFTTTVVITKPTTVVSTIIQPTTYTTTQPVREPDWTITAGVAIVALIIGFLTAWLLKKR